ncbi:BORA N, Rep fac-A C and/or tRNA anti-codon domain containing protein, partial [Asbolus verrucosus]
MSSKYKLTEGALQIIMNGGDVAEPTMQILGSKKILSNIADKERHRILLSDSRNTISFAMISTQINDRIGAGATQMYSVIKLKRYITSLINSIGKGDTRVLLILDMDLIASGDIVGQTIGTPVPLTDGETSVSQSSNNSISNKALNAYRGISFYKNSMGGDSANNSLSTTKVISPIASLSPFHNNWVIKARISNKTSIRTWSNERGEGKVFSFDLIDESGEIRCTAFKDLVDKFFDHLEVDKVYYISKGELKPTNKQFCTFSSEYEMTLSNESIIEESSDNNSVIPKVKYDFVSIDKVAAMESGTFVAETFDGSNNPVVLIKGAKIGEYGGGKSLSTIMNSHFKVNPDIAECYRLKGWYELEGSQVETQNISERGGIGALQTSWMTFKEVQDNELGHSYRGDYYQTMGTILLTRSDKLLYKACPTTDCNKKVIDMENGMYRCEKCNREYPNFKYRLLPNISTPPSRFAKILNPFESHLIERLHLPTFSPSVFAQVSTPKTDEKFKWTIDDISSLKPANIDEATISQHVMDQDPTMESLVQEKIDKFFNEKAIAPSPLNEHVKRVALITSPISKPQYSNNYSQTVLTLPPILPKHVEEVLKPYFTYTSPQQKSQFDENSSLYRKLFDFEEHSIHESVESSPALSTGLSPIQFSPEFNPSSPKRNFGSPIEMPELRDCNLSPIGRSPREARSACRL